MPEARGNGRGILGMGAALPAEIRTNDHWREDPVGRKALERSAFTTAAERAARTDVDPEIVRHLGQHAKDPFNGTRERRVLDPSLSSSDLELAAARAALSAGEIAPEEIDALLVYSILPDELHPLNHALLAHALGLRNDVIALSVDASCGSFPPHLYLAGRMIDGHQIRKVLIVQSSVMSRLMDYSSPSSFNAGDGATACIVGQVAPHRGIIGYQQHTRGDLHGSLRVFSPSNPDAAWYETDRHALPLAFGSWDARASAELITRAASHCRETCEALLAAHDVAASEVAFLATGQPTSWFADACASAIGIGEGRTLSTFGRYAHLMPASPGLNLAAAQSQAMLADDDIVLVYAPGIGSIQMALLLRWSVCGAHFVEISAKEGASHAVAV